MSTKMFFIKCFTFHSMFRYRSRYFHQEFITQIRLLKFQQRDKQNKKTQNQKQKRKRNQGKKYIRFNAKNCMQFGERISSRSGTTYTTKTSNLRQYCNKNHPLHFIASAEADSVFLTCNCFLRPTTTNKQNLTIKQISE